MLIVLWHFFCISPQEQFLNNSHGLLLRFVFRHPSAVIWLHYFSWNSIQMNTADGMALMLKWTFWPVLRGFVWSWELFVWAEFLLVKWWCLVDEKHLCRWLISQRGMSLWRRVNVSMRRVHRSAGLWRSIHMQEVNSSSSLLTTLCVCSTRVIRYGFFGSVFRDVWRLL